MFPACFLALAAIAVLGGILHPPSNYDGLAYRTPRVLHWLAAGRWHWIETEFERLNTRAIAFEWVTAPMIALLRTDRFLFLINAASIALLPGLVFGMFRRLGIAGKVARTWMWILPSGYCYLLQAGSIGNDLFGAIFPLAAIYFALRARRSHRVLDVWLSILAAALMTGSKATNLPLMLPWLIAVFPSLKLLGQKIMSGVAIALLAISASFLPQAFENYKHCGDWSGLAAEHTTDLTKRPLLRFANNSVLFVLQNFEPPITPFAKAWNEYVPRKMPARLRHDLEENFEPSGAHWELSEMEVEEAAGAGVGVCGLVMITTLAGLFSRKRAVNRALQAQSVEYKSTSRLAAAIMAGTLVALAAYLFKSGLSSVARILSPYYPLLIAGALLLATPKLVMQTRWWRALAFAVLLMASGLVIISPARPLWPANTVLSRGAGKSRILARAQNVYSVYAQRWDAFEPARPLLPTAAPVLGMVTFDDPETSLWRPFFHQRIEHVTRKDTPESLKQRGIEYVFVCKSKFNALFEREFEDWLSAMHGQVTGTIKLKLRASAEPTEWVIVHFESRADHAIPSGAGDTKAP